MRNKIAYAAGDLGCNMSFVLKGTVQTFWLVYMTLETDLLSALLPVVQIWESTDCGWSLPDAGRGLRNSSKN